MTIDITPFSEKNEIKRIDCNVFLHKYLIRFDIDWEKAIDPPVEIIGSMYMRM